MSDLASILGDDYKEGMTVEEIAAALSTKELIDATKVPKSVSKDVFDKTASELASIKRERDALKQQGMSEAEKTAVAMEEMKNALKQREQQLNKLSVEKIFVSNGMNEADYKDMLDDVVTDDLDKSTKLATKFVDLLKKQQASTEAKVKAELLKATPRAQDGGMANNSTDIAKRIEEAKESGDMPLAMALTRQQAEQMAKNIL